MLIFEVDEHHHVLLAPSVAALLLSRPGASLLLFDSHDDLGVPAELQTTDDPAALVAACDIGSWIMPLLSSGALSRVLWVTAYANVPPCAFACCVHQSPAGAITVSGAGVPPLWRALWGDAYCTTTPEWACHAVSIEVVAPCDAVAAVRCLPVDKGLHVTLDMDFFSTRNPARRSLPFDEFPSLRRGLWALAQAVPIESGLEFHTILLRMLAGEDSHATIAAALRSTATGTAWGPPLNATAIDDIVAAAPPRFAALSPGGCAAAVQALLLAHLPDHVSTESEIVALLASFADTLAAARSGGAPVCDEVLLARSAGMYTPPRQLADIRERVLGIIARQA